ncbi:MAG TPA: translocation/assembly module TamB [Longimicrobiales bacterium]|nr:translocation/assembly module TamB [Longimicrobiales bacterium]
MNEDTRTTSEAAREAPQADVPVSIGDPESPRKGVRWGLWLTVAAWTLVALVVLGVALLSQTQAGQGLVIDRGLELVRGSLAGELGVDEVRTRTLLTGLTLSGVRLDAEGGRRFLTADSIVVRYSPLSLALGSPRFRSTTIHGLDLEISRYPGDDFLNVGRVLAEGPPEPDSAAPRRPRTIGLGRISVREGLVQVLTPVGDAPAAHTVPAPGGGTLRRLAFEIGDLDLEETLLRPEGPVIVDARLASLTTSVSLLERPLVIREAFGRLSFGARGLEVSDAAIRLPGTLANGDVRFGPERPGGPWALTADLTADGWGELADIQWIDSRIPSGTFRGGVNLRAIDGLDVQLRGLEVQLEASHLVASGQVRFGDAIVMRGLRVTANPLSVSRLEPWVGRELPLDGFLSGQVVFGGTAANLQATGRLTLVPVGMGGFPTTADFSGTVHTGDDPGATGLEVRLDPLNYRMLERLWPDASALGGGSARLDINGRADDGIQVAADISLAPDPASASRWVGAGELRRGDDGRWATEVSGDFAPLSLSLLARIWPALQLAGTASGPVRAGGPLSDLQVSGDLAVGDGTLSFDGALDLETLGASYRVEADIEALRVSDFTARLPDPSVVSGRISLEGRGFALDSLDGRASVTVRPSRVGATRVDSASAVLSASAGVLTAETLDAHVSGVRVVGAGSIGMTPGAFGEASLQFVAASLTELRPIFMGDSLLVRDELNPLEQDLLRVRGIDPDTLPSALDVRMAGSAEGTADIRGRFGDLELELLVEMADVAYRHDQLDSARVLLSAGGLPATFGDWVVSARASGVVWAGRQFQDVEFGGAMSQRRGEGTLELQRRLNERYFVTGAFAIDSVGGYADLTDASIQIEDISWVLSGPTRIAWSENSLSVDSLEVTWIGEDPMHVIASGTLTRGGDSDFRLDMEGFHIEHAMQIVQREDVDVSGHIDLALTVVGPAERPVIDAVFRVEDPGFGAVRLSRLDGSLEYEDRSSQLRMEGWSGDRRVLSASGVLPLDLALTDVGERASGDPMDVTVTADSLEAAIPLAYLSALQDVRGMLSADFRITGSSRDPQPSGTVRLVDGAWTLEALGVRHTGVTGEVLLRPDRTLEVELGTTRSGTSTVRGVVTMDDFADPALDLVVTFDRFLAVDRRDMASTISGEFALGGRYRLPVAEGTLRVDEGTLFVEEFARASGIVDLTDPMLYADGFAVDTTVFVSQPVLAGLRNPFLDNLRVDIDMSVPRDMWLRSDEMNVEMGGDLLVRYDRGQGDLVLIGELQALRGSYVLFGRTFEVTGGTVAFRGQPGVNPSLDIQSRSRIRRQGNDPLAVLATVQGTLIQPRVLLSSEEAGLAQSDLISYLVFGVPSGRLGVGGAGSSGLGQNTVDSGLTLATGALANQVGTMLAQNFGLDYLAVSQGNAGGNQNFAENFLSSAQLEVGQYLADDVFVVLVISGPSAQATSAANEGIGVEFLQGIRVEWTLTDNTFVEGFIEDRFLRSGTGGLGVAGLDGGQVLGVLVIREWGYGSQH